MLHLLILWFLYAAALMLVTRIFPGVRLRNYSTALIAVVVIAVINALLGPILQFLAFPITILTLGIFALVVNAFLFWLAGEVLKGFEVKGGLQALGGSVVYTLLVMVIRYLFP